MWFVDEEIDKVVRRQGCYLVPPSDAQLPVMADALNVHEATGLTPSQLQARVAELERALVKANRRICAAADALQSVLKP